MRQPDLYYFETNRNHVTSLVKFTENTRLRLVLSIQNLTRLVTTSFLWFQNSIDQTVSQNKCQVVHVRMAFTGEGRSLPNSHFQEGRLLERGAESVSSFL